MSRPAIIENLNHLVRLHNRSFPVYLASARPWTRGAADDAASELLDTMVADHLETVESLGEIILDNEGTVALGEYPMAFTSKHDLSIEYLMRYVRELQGQMIEEIQGCVDRLADDATAQAAAQEALGAAKGHLQSLNELIADKPVSAG